NQYFEYDVLTPDTINEAFAALQDIEAAVGKAFHPEAGDADRIRRGREILADTSIDLREREILLDGVENSRRKVVLIKVREGYLMYKRMIGYYAATQLKQYFDGHSMTQFYVEYLAGDSPFERLAFENIGGQLIRKRDV